MKRFFLLYFLPALMFLSCSGREERVLRILNHSPVASLDPQTTDDFVSLSVLSNVYQTLVTYNEDLKLIPLLATSWSNPDENTWRFELRRNVIFHDGHEFSARDVKYSIERGMSDPQSFIKAEIPSVEKANVIDDHTVEIVTRKPFPLLLAKMSYIMIISEGSGAYIKDRTNGTGPYRLKEWNSNKEVILERFDRYWRGKPFWDQAVVKWNGDPLTRLKAIVEGHADLADAPPIQELLQSNSAEMIQHPSLGVMFLGFAVNQESPFSDPAVRKAIALSIDQQALIDQSLKGLAQAVAQLAPPDVFGYVSDLPYPKPDLTAAKASLEQSKFPRGFRQPLYFSSSYRPVAEFLGKELNKIGIQFDFQQVEMDKLDQLLFKQKAPAYLLQFTFPTLDSSDLLYFGFHTMTPDRSFGVLNFSGYSDPKLDQILEDSSTEMELAKRFDLLKQGMTMALESNVWIPLCVRLNLFAAGKRIRWLGNSEGRIVLEEIRLTE